MWLQSQDKYDSVAIFNPADRTLKRLSRQSLGDKAPGFEDIHGWFSDFSIGTSVVYKRESDIVFLICQKEFTLDSATKVEVSEAKAGRKLTVSRYGEEVFKVDYSLDALDLESAGVAAFAEDEDFDFFLFVSNLSKDSARKEVLLGRK